MDWSSTFLVECSCRRASAPVSVQQARIGVDRRLVVLRRADRRLVRIGILERVGWRLFDGDGIGRAVGFAPNLTGELAIYRFRKE